MFFKLPKLSSLLLSLWTLALLPWPLSAQAADYTPDKVPLTFSYEDSSSLRDFTSEFNSAQPETLKADQYLLIGPSVQTADKGEFEIFIGSQPLFEVLSQFQLRLINTQQVTNVDLLGTTAVELVGDSFSSFEPLRMVLFSFEGKSVALLYRGESASVFQNFLITISEPSPFAHEGPRHLFQKEIDDVVVRGIFSGYETENGQKEFRADQKINRAEFLKVIVLAAPGITEQIVQDFYASFKTQILEDDRLAREDEDLETNMIFPDVDREAWFAPYIFFAFDKDWVGGYPDGSFKPTSPINMAEAPKMILAARNTFLVPNLEVWFKPYMDYLNSKNVLVQRADQYRFSFTNPVFYPFAEVTRGQTAALLSRLLWIDEEALMDQFSQVVDAGSLPFAFESSAVQIFKLDRSLASENSEMSYLFFKNGRVMSEVLQFSPQSWTERARQDERVGDLAALKYLGENKAAVFASLKNCTTSSNCFSAQEKDDFETSFSVRPDDLLSFEDVNLGLRFRHSLPFEKQAQIEGDVKALQLTRDGQELVIFNLLENSSDDPAFFEGDQADMIRHFGNRDWYVYEKQVGEESQLRLATSVGVKKLLVAVVRNIKNVNDLDGKIIRMLRTMERF